MQILIVEDEEIFRRAIKKELPQEAKVDEAVNSTIAKKMIKSGDYNIIFIDINLEKEKAGFEVLQEAVKKNIFSVVLSGHVEESIIEEVYLLGASSYYVKDGVSGKVKNILRDYEKKIQNDGLDFDHFIAHDFLTKDQKTIDDLRFIFKNNSSHRSIFITGPTGVGKTYLAKKIHDLSNRKNENFVNLNCSEFSKDLIESEIFGHVKGAFTGALKNNMGKIELADKGTLFLDEIGTLPLYSQIKLLKVIDEKRFFPVGSNQEKTSDFRLISATCDNLLDLIQKGQFRNDLFYRLIGMNIHLKSLNERKEDIPLYIQKASAGKKRFILAPDAKEALLNYSWPGNVREIFKTIHNFTEHEDFKIHLKNLPPSIQQNRETESEITDQHEAVTELKSLIGPGHMDIIKKGGWKELISVFKKEVIKIYLEKNDGNINATIKELGVSPSWYYGTKSKNKTSND